MMKRKDTRDRILKSAAELIHASSYNAVGVNAVCETAGVSKGSFFHFFESKRDLALAVLDEFKDRIGEVILSESFQTELLPMQRLERFVSLLYTFQKEQKKQIGYVPGCPFGNIALEQATQDEVLRQKVDSCLRTVADHIRDSVEEAVVNGDIEDIGNSENINVDATAEAMLAYVEGVQLLAKSRNDPEIIRLLGPAIKSIRVLY